MSQWLDENLADAEAKGEVAIIFCHEPLLPGTVDERLEVALLWNFEARRDCECDRHLESNFFLFFI